jgi:hypothetical protein
VSAIAPNLERASYSNFGPSVDIAAPGGALRNGIDYGVWSLWWSFASNTPSYEALEGTSMAAPHVTGAAALVLAANPGLTRSELRARLLDHAADLGAEGEDDEFGAGLVDADAAVRDGEASRATYVFAFDVGTGAVRGRTVASASGGYSIAPLPDGEYYVYAGEDRDGDELAGIFDRRWGARGGSTSPSPVTIDRSSIESVSFSIGYPQESESNDSRPSADVLPVGGYAYGTIDSSSDVDVYRFVLAESETVVVETDAFLGACGYTDQVDTVVRLLDSHGAQLATHDDVDAAHNRHCSRIQSELPAGTYYVEVAGWRGDQGHYALRVAEES